MVSIMAAIRTDWHAPSLRMGCGLVVLVVLVLVVGHALWLGHMGHSVLRGACWQQRRNDARRHGSARQAPKDQHHHQQEEKAATHPNMIRRAGKRFRPCALSGALFRHARRANPRKSCMPFGSMGSNM